jgi:hypothetical protein
LQEDSFSLYYLPDDLGETRDLRAEEPEKYGELLEAWSAYAREARVQFPPPGTMD